MEDWVKLRIEQALNTGITGPNRFKPDQELEAIRTHIRDWKTYTLRVPSLDEEDYGRLFDYIDVQAINAETAIVYFHAGFFLDDAPYQIVCGKIVIEESGPMEPGLNPHKETE